MSDGVQDTCMRIPMEGAYSACTFILNKGDWAWGMERRAWSMGHGAWSVLS